MIELIVGILINSIYIVGLKESTESGMILESVYAVLETILPEWAFMPILGCVQCMASFHGVLFFILAKLTGHFDEISFWMLLVYIPAVSFVNIALDMFLVIIYQKGGGLE